MWETQLKRHDKLVVMSHCLFNFLQICASRIFDNEKGHHQNFTSPVLPQVCSKSLPSLMQGVGKNLEGRGFSKWLTPVFFLTNQELAGTCMQVTSNKKTLWQINIVYFALLNCIARARDCKAVYLVLQRLQTEPIVLIFCAFLFINFRQNLKLAGIQNAADAD